jgi:rod shape-determining protein MreC
MNQFINSKKSGGWQKIGLIKIITGIIVLVLFVGILNLFSAKIRNGFYSLTLPVQKVFLNAGSNTASAFGSVFNFGNLQKENENLKNENQKLLSQMALLYDSSEQTQAVKDILACSQPEDFNLVLANITGFDSKEDFILIDKGKDDGISENMAVVSQQKVLFGKISKVYKSFSQVMLISNKNSVLDVKIIDGNLVPIYGVIRGKGGLTLYLDLVPTDSEINAGDILTTSALEGIFPKDLLVGKIKQKEKNDLKPFQTATVEQFFDIKITEKLFVITDYMKIK